MKKPKTLYEIYQPFFGRGGKREGAGRKTEDGAHDMLRVNVMLDQPTIDRATKLGEGNLSLGIRKQFKKRYTKSAKSAN